MALPCAESTLERVQVLRLCSHMMNAELERFAGFYRGRIAEAIVKALQEQGGVMTTEDLASHKTRLGKPISTTYRGLTIHEIPPPTQVLCASRCARELSGWWSSMLGHHCSTQSLCYRQLLLLWHEASSSAVHLQPCACSSEAGPVHGTALTPELRQLCG